MSISFQEAKSLLANITTLDQLRDLIATIDVRGSGTQTVLYSGKVGDLGSEGIALALSNSDPNVRIINKTEVADFLISKELKEWFVDHDYGDAKASGRDGTERSIANKFLFETEYEGKLGAWATASDSFVNSPVTAGDVKIVGPFADTGRVFGQVEFKALMDNPNVNSIDGLEKSYIKSLADAALAAGKTPSQIYSIQLAAVMNHSAHQLSTLNFGAVDGNIIQHIEGERTKVPTHIDAHNYLPNHLIQPFPLDVESVSVVQELLKNKNSPNGEAVPSDFERGNEADPVKAQQVKEQFLADSKFANEQLIKVYQDEAAAAAAANDQARLARATKILANLGVVGDAVFLGYVVHKANEAWEAGDKDKAVDLVADWGVGFAGGLAGGAAAAALVSSALAPLYLTGPVGMVLAGSISLVAGVAGGIVGEAAFKAAFNDLLGIDTDDDTDVPDEPPIDVPVDNPDDSNDTGYPENPVVIPPDNSGPIVVPPNNSGDTPTIPDNPVQPPLVFDPTNGEPIDILPSADNNNNGIWDNAFKLVESNGFMALQFDSGDVIEFDLNEFEVAIQYLVDQNGSTSPYIQKIVFKSKNGELHQFEYNPVTGNLIQATFWTDDRLKQYWALIHEGGQPPRLELYEPEIELPADLHVIDIESLKKIDVSEMKQEIIKSLHDNVELQISILKQIDKHGLSFTDEMAHYTGSLDYEFAIGKFEADVLDERGSSTGSKAMLTGYKWTAKDGSGDYKILFVDGTSKTKAGSIEHTRNAAGVTDVKILSGTVGGKPVYIDAGQIGSIFGSTLGRSMAGNNQYTQIVVSEFFGKIGENIADMFALTATPQSFSEAVDNAFTGFTDIDLRDVGVGAISAAIALELSNALGLAEKDGNAFQSLVTPYIEQWVGSGFSYTVPEMNTFKAVLTNYLGTELGKEAYQVESREGALAAQIGTYYGSTFGATYGAEVGVKVGGSIMGPIGAVIGAAIGYVLGGVFGDFLNDLLHDDHPRASIRLTFNETQENFALNYDYLHKADGGNKNLAINLATEAVGLLNNVLTAINGYVVNTEINAGTYGHYEKLVSYWPEGRTSSERYNFKDNTQALLYFGLFNTLSDLEVAGGNAIYKRALFPVVDQILAENVHHRSASGVVLESGINGAATTYVRNRFVYKYSELDPDAMTTFKGTLSIASQYDYYLQFQKEINSLMAAQPNTVFTLAWLNIIKAAEDLELHRRQDTDHMGGWQELVTNLQLDGTHFSDEEARFETTRFRYENNERLIDIDAWSPAHHIHTERDYIKSSLKEEVNFTTQSALNQIIENAYSSLVINGTNNSDVIQASNLGDDVFGGDGNDVITGGSQADWIFGGEGDDVLSAGEGNNNLLVGEQGNDTLIGGTGSDWLIGDIGNDILNAKDGDNVLDGGQGNDQLSALGGKDIYLFRAGDGIDQITDFNQDEKTESEIKNNSKDKSRVAGSLLIRDAYTSGSMSKVADAIEFGSNITLEQLSIREDQATKSLIISLVDIQGNELNSISITNWDKMENRIEWLRFSSGLEIDLIDLLISSGGYIKASSLASPGQTNAGASTVFSYKNDDYIIGDNTDEKLNGGSGKDIIFGRSGNDILIGGAGDDVLNGDDGSDVYWFDKAWGNDEIINLDTGIDKKDAIEFGLGIEANPEVVRGVAHNPLIARKQDDNLILSIKGKSDTITVRNYFLMMGIAPIN
ncbi:MAG: hypothetical protein IPK77_03180 [Cellvibrio sp.]|nr:hypothetical protein [Cellvibrio sp.]